MSSTKVKIHRAVRYPLDIDLGSEASLDVKDKMTHGLAHPLYQRLTIFGSVIEGDGREKLGL